MISMTLCLGNGLPKLTGLMGLWPRNSSCCLGSTLMVAGVFENLAAPRTCQERGGAGSKQQELRSWWWGEGLRTESSHRQCWLLFWLDHWPAWTSVCTFPSLSFLYKTEVITAPRYRHSYFLPPVVIYLSLALPLMLIWASSPIYDDIVSTSD